jgi:CheY-specific phosphatase CheX
VRSLHPQLPVLWLTNTREVVTAFLKQPTAALPDNDRAGLREHAARLLRDEFYASDLVHEISDVSQEVLSEFGLKTGRSEPYIKSNLTLLSDVNALIGFSGEGLSGHLILSASTDDASAVYRKLEPNVAQPQYDDLEDLLGEVTNRVLGKIKRVFETRGLSFKLRPPSFIRGPQARYRNKAGCPSLAIEFSEEGGLLRLEFCIDRMNAPSLVSQSDLSFMDSGEITFL